MDAKKNPGANLVSQYGSFVLNPLPPNDSVYGS